MKTYKVIIFGIVWSVLDTFDKQKIKFNAYQKGYELSQKFKHYESWDNIFEPFAIRQIVFLTEVSNSFIKGLISDNEPNKNYLKKD